MRDAILTEAVRLSLRTFPANAKTITMQLSMPGGPTVIREVDLTAPDPDAATSHDPDYRRCVWYADRHRFTPTQARCVGVLWEALRDGTPELAQATILRRANCCADRLRDVFRNWRGGMNPAWGTMIVATGKGVYRLRVPGEPAPPNSPG